MKITLKVFKKPAKDEKRGKGEDKELTYNKDTKWSKAEGTGDDKKTTTKHYPSHPMDSSRHRTVPHNTHLPAYSAKYCSTTGTSSMTYCPPAHPWHQSEALIAPAVVMGSSPARRSATIVS